MDEQVSYSTTIVTDLCLTLTDHSYAAMGEITRSFPFVHEDASTFDLTIREPPITGESLGLKTWGSSYVLAKLLPWIAKDSLSHVLGAMQGPEAQVLELGSGTGLLGMAAACFWRAPVILTDLPTITPNLAHNVDVNRSIAEAFGGSMDTAPLTWGDHDQIDKRFHTPHQYQVSGHRNQCTIQRICLLSNADVVTAHHSRRSPV